MGWTSDAKNCQLVNVKYANIIYLSFVSPTCTYKNGQNTWEGTGLSFSSDFSVIKDAISILRAKDVVVMLSVGGSTYPFPDNYNADGIAALVLDLNCNGIDIDWENNQNKALFGGYIAETRRVLGEDYSISTAAFSVGAYGEGNFANETPGSDNTGMNLQGIKSNGQDLDWINIMSYDASNVYIPTKAYEAYRSYYKGPILLGAEIPPESWGGHIIDLDQIKNYAEYIKKDTSCMNGIFVWSYQKTGSPSCDEILSTAISTFNDSITSVPTTPVPTTPVTLSTLVGQSVFGKTIEQDGKSEWVKVNGVTIGDTFTYESYNSKDIGTLLDTVIKDTKVVALLYNWKTGDAYSKTGYDFNNTSDTKLNSDFTSFIVKSRANNTV